MSLLAKPFLDSYIQSFNVPIERMKNPLVFHLLCAALGLYMVASSTFIELYVDLEALRVSYTVSNARNAEFEDCGGLYRLDWGEF